jgi:hypothetical protein
MREPATRSSEELSKSLRKEDPTRILFFSRRIYMVYNEERNRIDNSRKGEV